MLWPSHVEQWVRLTGIIFIASMLTLVRAFLAIKLFFLTLFLLAFFWAIYRKKAHVAFHRRLAWFYLWIGTAGLAWAFVGLLHPTNYSEAVPDALRLYALWSAAFFVLYTLLHSMPSLRVFHVAMVVAGILIPLINFVGLYDKYNGLGLISDSVRDQLGLEIGIWDTYLQFSSINILSMFLVAPYLLALQFRADAGKSNSLLAKVSLTLSLILVALSGRRALWMVVALTPCTILFVSYLTDSYRFLRVRGRRILLACALVSVAALTTVMVLPEGVLDVGSVTRFQEAFSSEDARTIQKPYLIKGFLKSPLLGTGFGGRAAYIRSDEQPWDYELTYYQMLFNLGAVGMAVLGTLFAVYIGAVVRLLRQFREGSAIPFGLLIAYFSLLAGAYSNPYFGGFDSLFFAGLLPYLSTFQHGFEGPGLATGAAL
jgi:hypothetical protein